MTKLDFIGNILIVIVALTGVTLTILHILKKRLKHKKVIENIFFVIVILIVVVLGTNNNQKKKQFKSELKMLACLSIGEVSNYRSGRSPLVVLKFVNSTGRTPAIEYHFNLNGETIVNKYDAYKADVPSGGIKEGEKYLVLYDKDNPTENRMFFSYPIRDSTDFKKYVKEFEQMRKQELLKNEKEEK
jgi:hypothetical protein